MKNKLQLRKAVSTDAMIATAGAIGTLTVGGLLAKSVTGRGGIWARWGVLAVGVAGFAGGSLMIAFGNKTMKQAGMGVAVAGGMIGVYGLMNKPVASPINLSSLPGAAQSTAPATQDEPFTGTVIV